MKTTSTRENIIVMYDSIQYKGCSFIEPDMYYLYYNGISPPVRSPLEGYLNSSGYFSLGWTP